MNQLHRTARATRRRGPRETGVVVNAVHLLAGVIAQGQRLSIGQPPNVRAKHKLFGCAKFGTELGWILCDNQITARLERGVGREGEIDAVGKIPPAKVFRPVTGIVQLDKLDRRRLWIGVVVNLVDDNARSDRAWPSDAKRGEKLERTNRHPPRYGLRTTSSLK